MRGPSVLQAGLGDEVIPGADVAAGGGDAGPALLALAGAGDWLAASCLAAAGAGDAGPALLAVAGAGDWLAASCLTTGEAGVADGAVPDTGSPSDAAVAASMQLADAGSGFPGLASALMGVLAVLSDFASTCSSHDHPLIAADIQATPSAKVAVETSETSF